MTPKISVIIPAYNSAKYLQECLNSILNQSFTDIEIIAVDDGSTDGETPRILDNAEKNDARVRVIHKENAGVSAARNDGLLAALGEYVLFADSDDYLSMNALQTFYENAKQTAADIVIGDYFAVTTKGLKRHEFFSKPFVVRDRSLIEQLQQTMLYCGYSPYYSKSCGYLFGAQWTKLFRREMLVKNNILFPTAISLFEDGIFGLTAFEFAKTISYLQKPVYYYRILQSSLCHSFEYNHLDLYKRISEEINSFMERYGKGQNIYDAYEARFVYYAKKQVGQIFASNAGFWEKYRQSKRLLTDAFYVPFLKKINKKPLVQNEKLFGLLVRCKLYLLLSVLMQIRRG